jgi:hypothetical protein
MLRQIYSKIRSQKEHNFNDIRSYIEIQSNSNRISKFEELIKCHGLDNLDPFHVGLYFWGKGIQSVSIKFLERANSLDPHNPYVVGALAKAYECSEAFTLAEDLYSRTVSLNSLDLIREFGAYLQRRGRVSEANDLISLYPISKFDYPWLENDLYSESFENDVWFDYLTHSRISNPPPRDNSGFAFNLYDNLIRNHLTTDFRGLLDTGVFCPVVFEDIALAPEFSKMKFIGADRSPNIETKNATQFKLAGNLEYVTWDSDTYLPANIDLSSFMAVHMRTVTLMTAEEALQFYKSLYKSGVKKVIGIEFAGLTKYDSKFVGFESLVSEKMRYPMWIHPLVSIARDSGFTETSVTYLPKPILLQDFGLGESIAVSVTI